MPRIEVHDIHGKIAGEMELPDNFFGAVVNKNAMHCVVVNFLANKRHGTQSTKTRTEVRGGGKKPWRQKGTGRARQGSIRAPQWKGGGVALGPKPRDYSYKINKKIKSLALKSALSSKVLEKKMIVLDELVLNDFSTKFIVNIFKNLKTTSDALFVTSDNNKFVVNSVRNINKSDTTFIGMMNTYEILTHTHLIFTKEAVEKLKEVRA